MKLGGPSRERRLEINFVMHGGEDIEYFDVVDNFDLALENVTYHLNHNHKWYLDSGVSNHVTGNKKALDSVRVEKGGTVMAAGGEQYRVEGCRNVHVFAGNRGIKLDNILYVPSAQQLNFSRSTCR